VTRRLLPTLPLRAWLIVAYSAVLLLPVLVLFASGALGRDLVRQTRWDLEHQSALLTMLVGAVAADGDLAAHERVLSRHLREAKHATLSGIRLVDADGIVVASSGDRRVLGEDLGGDPEVVAALAGAGGSVVRPRPRATNAPLDSRSRRATVRVFVASPVRVDGRIVGAIVLSRTPREEVQALYQMAPAGLWQGAVLAVLATVAFGWLSSAVLTRSLSAVDRAAQRVADGHFDGLADLQRPKRSHLREVGRAALSVETMAVRLRDRLAYISEFASNVSHEFKTPLATLKGTLELLADDPDMPPDQRTRFMTNASQSVDRLERLVTGLLSLARAEETPDESIVDLEALVAASAERHGATWRGPLAPVRGDRSQLDAVVSNLLENARVHGGRAWVEGFVDGGRTGFAVVDDGPGISPANLPQVFDRFFTTKRGQGSSGLGLALVRAIVFTHGGEVTVASRPGHTVFTVTLPAADRSTE
jgi:signal transduction histidine kinase